MRDSTTVLCNYNNILQILKCNITPKGRTRVDYAFPYIADMVPVNKLTILKNLQFRIRIF